jgi:hypothetical protein
MPRNGSGTMQIPNTLVTGTPIEAGPHNANYADIASELTNSLALDGQSQLSGPLKAASGTVGSPGITFGSDTDSGVWRKGGNNLGVGVGGAEVLDISSSGLGVTGALSATGALSVASIATTADLPITEGGTGQSTAIAAFNALSPQTTRGDLITRDATNDVRLPIGAADTLLKSDGTDPSYGKLVNANITDGTIAHAKLASGVTATQANMEAASATDTFVTPGRQHFHPGHPKAGGNLNGTGTPAFAAGDYGMGAVTDNGAGDYTLAFDTAFANTNYWLIASPRGDSNNNGAIVSPNPGSSKTTSAYQVDIHENNGTGQVDSTEIGISFWGDYA